MSIGEGRSDGGFDLLPGVADPHELGEDKALMKTPEALSRLRSADDRNVGAEREYSIGRGGSAGTTNDVDVEPSPKEENCSLKGRFF